MPSFSRARRFLRIVEIQRVKKAGKTGMMRQLADLAGLPTLIFGSLLLKPGKGEKAVVAAEKLMAINPLNPSFVEFFCKAARVAEQIEIAVQTLELVVEAEPGDMVLTRALGDIYNEIGNYMGARNAYEKVVQARPHDAQTAKLLKEMDAQTSMQSGGWEEAEGKEGGYRDLIKDKEQASKLDIQAKAVVAGDDLEAMVAEQRAKIEKEPRNINAYRALIRLYRQRKLFAEAVAVTEEALKINTADPDLDRTLSELRALDYEARVDALREAGQVAEADELDAVRAQFVFDDLLERVKRYPNDLRLRFELGLQYFDNEYYDEAIQQLQLAQRSPKERNDALYYLARCFRNKNQPDLATMQLETALEQLPTMDDSRKQVLFELGEIAEEAGETDKAFDYYREVYGADIAYRDIGEKMERIYKARKKE
ncbi:MAG: tetratricopeptide repeat protein [Lentisphaerae bacterium]|nr:tetratricopeptide repeat protein [Lentisphaerota bacterium]